jgi:hypothetical protein
MESILVDSNNVSSKVNVQCVGTPKFTAKIKRPVYEALISRISHVRCDYDYCLVLYSPRI